MTKSIRTEVERPMWRSMRKEVDYDVRAEVDYGVRREIHQAIRWGTQLIVQAGLR